MNINFKYLFFSLLFALSIIGIIFFGYIFILNMPKINFSMPKPKMATEIPDSASIKSDLNQAFAVFNKNFNSNSENLNEINNILESGGLTSKEVSNRFLDVIYTERFGIKKSPSKILAYKLGFANKCKNASCFSKNSLDAYDGALYPKIQNKHFSYVKLKDGTTYAFTYFMSACKTESSGYTRGCGFGYVDINGNKKPNILNVDIFQFRLIRNPKTGYITMHPYLNEKTYKNLYEECYINGGSCTTYALKGDTSYILNRRLSECQKKSKKSVWLDKEEKCCTSDSTKNCCESNSVFQPNGSGKFIEKGYYGAKRNVCCYNKNTSEACCKAITGADGYFLNGKCVSGTIKTSLDKGNFNFVLNSNSTQGFAYLISKNNSYKIFEIAGNKSAKALNLDAKSDYLLYSTYENYGAKLKVVRGSCKLKNFDNNYYLLTNKKVGETCIVSFLDSKNKVQKPKNINNQQCVKCSNEVSKGSYLACCK